MMASGARLLGGRAPAEGDDRGAQYRGFGDVIVLALDGRAFPLADVQRHLIDDDPVPPVIGNPCFSWSRAFRRVSLTSSA